MSSSQAHRARASRRTNRARWARIWNYLGGVIEGANRLAALGDLTQDECRSIRELVAGVSFAAIGRLAEQPRDTAGQ